MRLTPDPAALRRSQKARRAKAFREEADPLLAQWLAGEIDETAWRAKRDEIRQRYPMPQDVNSEN